MLFRTCFIFTFIFSISYSSIAQDSLNMRKMANLTGLGTAYNDVWGYTWGNKDYAIIGSNTAINIVDVTDCSNPIVVNSWVDGGSKSWRDFKDYRGYIYGVCDSCNEGLQTMDKDTFNTWQSNSDFGSAHNIFIDKKAGRLYAAGANNNNKGLWVYDLTKTPKRPQLLAEIDFQDWDGIAGAVNWYVHDVYVKNDTAYCSHGYRGHAVWDMSDLSNIVKIGERLGDDGYNHSSWTHDDLPYEYVAREVPNGLPLEIYDNSDWSDIEIEGSFSHTLHPPTAATTTSTAHNPYYYNDRLFVSNYHDGLKVYDLTDPLDPTILAYYDTYDTNNGYYGNGPSQNSYKGCWGTYPFLSSGCILASDITYGLYTLKLLETPTRDVILSDRDLVLDKNGGAIYFATRDSKLWSLSVNNAGSLVKTLEFMEPIGHVEIVNSNLGLSTPGSSIYLRSPAGSYFKISVTNAGTISAPIFKLPGEIPANATRIESEDIYLSQYAAGLHMTSPDGTCYLVKVGPGGITEVDNTGCD